MIAAEELTVVSIGIKFVLVPMNLKLENSIASFFSVGLVVRALFCKFSKGIVLALSVKNLTKV